MKKTNNSLHLVPFLALFLVASCSSTPKKSTDAKSEKLNQLVDQYFEERLKLEPLYATSIGDHRFDDQLPLLSEEHRQKEWDLVKKTLAAVKGLGCDQLGEEEHLTCLTLTDDLESQDAVFKTDLYRYLPFDQLNNFPSEFAELASGSSSITFKTQSDYENFLKRMKVMPAFIDTMIENMKAGLSRKITVPRILAKKGLKQLKDLLPPDYQKSIFYKQVPNIDLAVKDQTQATRLKQEYANEIQNHLYPAYRKLAAFVEKEYLPHTRTTSGIGSLPGGKDAYLALVRVNTTTTLSPDEIMNIGYGQVKHILEQLKDAQKQVGFKGNLRQFFHYLRTDSKIYPFKTEDEILDYYRSMQAKLMEKVPSHFRLIPKEKLEVKEVEKFKAATASESYSNGDPTSYSLQYETRCRL